MPFTVLNDDVEALIRRIDRTLVELNKSASANLTDVRSADRTRIDDYLNNLVSFKAWAYSQPQVDRPETHPTPNDVPDSPSLPPAESDFIRDLEKMLVRLRSELINSQSARLPNGFQLADSNRFDEAIDRFKRYLTDHVDEITSIDFPESSPRNEITG